MNIASDHVETRAHAVGVATHVCAMVLATHLVCAMGVANHVETRAHASRSLTLTSAFIHSFIHIHASSRVGILLVRSFIHLFTYCKPTSGHLLYSVYAFGTRLQAHIGSLALLFYCYSMLSAHECSSRARCLSVGHC